MPVQGLLRKIEIKLHRRLILLECQMRDGLHNCPCGIFSVNSTSRDVGPSFPQSTVNTAVVGIKTSIHRLPCFLAVASGIPMEIPCGNKLN
eukprot:COSAG02_NODE_2374_length_9019_cov_784.726121_3_plen_91_part_00